MKPYIYAVGAILCWASLPAATGTSLLGLSTEELMFYSFASASIFLYIQHIIINKSPKLALPTLKGSFLGIFGIFGYHYAYFKGLAVTPLAEGAILTTTWSFWIVVFSSVIMFRRLKPLIIIIAFAGLFGAVLVISAGKNLSFRLEHMDGYILCLLCGLIWSTFTVALPYARLKKDPMTMFTIYAFAISTLLYIAKGEFRIPETKALLSAVYLGVVPLGLSFFLWNRAAISGNLSILGFLSYLTTPLAVLFVVIFNGAKIDAQAILGMIVIICASITGKIIVKYSK